VPETSIVIRAFNEERHLPGLFDGLAGQGYRDFETIVVDSGSFDRTRDIAERRADRLVRIKSDDFTFGHSLNVGIAHGRGRFIVIVSAHTAPTSGRWLENLVAALHDPRTAMVYGQQQGSADSKFSERRDFARTFGTHPRTLAPPDFFANNANSAVRRELWERHRFDEALPGLEDVEWAKHWMEQGYRVVYAAAAGAHRAASSTARRIFTCSPARARLQACRN
jgi:glycosyltransferase involved in cell wall biosynthesis